MSNKGPPGNINNQNLLRQKKELEHELVNYENTKKEMISKYYNMLNELDDLYNLNDLTMEQEERVKQLETRSENLNTEIVKYNSDMRKYKQLVKNYF